MSRIKKNSCNFVARNKKTKNIMVLVTDRDFRTNTTKRDLNAKLRGALMEAKESIKK